MNRLVIVFFVALVAIHVDSFVNPRDLADEVQKQLDELANVVQGQILIGHSNLENNELAFLTNSNNKLISGELSIGQERDSINQQIDVIKSLANSVGKDISVCTDIRVPLLDSLPGQYGINLRDCITRVNREEARIVGGARYTIDVAVNKVHSIQFEVDSCAGNLLCLSPIVTDIELEKVRLPQNIRTEVDAAVSAMSTLRISVGNCADENISQYVADASSIVHDITVCANAVIG